MTPGWDLNGVSQVESDHGLALERPVLAVWGFYCSYGEGEYRTFFGRHKLKQQGCQRSNVALRSEQIRDLCVIFLISKIIINRQPLPLLLPDCD